MEKLTSYRNETRSNNKNLVLDLSEDLKTKSKKLRKEMEKISKILETEISECNNLSGNISATNFSKLKEYENLKTQQNFKKENLKINPLMENSDLKHFKKITYEPKNNKKFNLIKNSPIHGENNKEGKINEFNNIKN